MWLHNYLNTQSSEKTGITVLLQKKQPPTVKIIPRALRHSVYVNSGFLHIDLSQVNERELKCLIPVVVPTNRNHQTATMVFH